MQSLLLKYLDIEIDFVDIGYENASFPILESVISL